MDAPLEEITFIADSGEIARAGRVVQLTRVEMDLFDGLHFSHPRPRSRDMLFDDAYGERGDAGEPDPRTVDVHLCKMRKKLQPLGISIDNANSFGWKLGLGPLPDAFGSVLPAADELARMKPAERTFARLLSQEMGAEPAASSAPRATTPVAPAAPLRDGDVELGRLEAGGAVGIDLSRLIDGRLLIQGASGAGKSWTMRRLLEQTAGRIQQIVVDPEGEFKSLAEHCGLTVIEAHRLDAAALALAAARARTHRLSLLFDLSDATRDQQMQAVASVFAALIDAPRADWHPCLVAVDEAHLFAPLGTHTIAGTAVRKASVAALTDLMSRGRKRGLCGVLATQRLARLAKSVVSEAHNFLVGLNTLDLDIRRAAETIGWDATRAMERLPALSPGSFVAIGPAFSHQSGIVQVGPVVSQHVGARPELSAPDAVDGDMAAGLLDIDALIEASAADEAERTESARPAGLKAVRAFVRHPSFAHAGMIWNALAPLAPQGASVADLARHLDIDEAAIAGAVALLDQFAAVEIMEGPPAAVRVAQDMTP